MRLQSNTSMSDSNATFSSLFSFYGVLRLLTVYLVRQTRVPKTFYENMIFTNMIFKKQ